MGKPKRAALAALAVPAVALAVVAYRRRKAEDKTEGPLVVDFRDPETALIFTAGAAHALLTHGLPLTRVERMIKGHPTLIRLAVDIAIERMGVDLTAHVEAVTKADADRRDQT